MWAIQKNCEHLLRTKMDEESYNHDSTFSLLCNDWRKKREKDAEETIDFHSYNNIYEIGKYKSSAYYISNLWISLINLITEHLTYYLIFLYAQYLRTKLLDLIYQSCNRISKIIVLNLKIITEFIYNFVLNLL